MQEKLQSQKTILGYLDSYESHDIEILTAEKLESLMNSALVKDIMTKIRATEDKKKQKALKEGLPCAMFQCQRPEKGIRKRGVVYQPSGLCMHDWDGMKDDPREFYDEYVRGNEKEVGIVLAHVTPRGHGLRLVTTMQSGETIPQCQERIAALFYMEKYRDWRIKDLPRPSFIPSADTLLYKDDKGLFEHEREIPPSKPSEGGRETRHPQGEKVAVDKSELIAESFDYHGIKFSTIIDKLLERIATGGEPREGERNDDLFRLVRELRHICEYNFSKVYMLVRPYFPTLQDSEVRRTISSAIATNGRTITPELRGVLDEIGNEDVDVTEKDDSTSLKKLPTISPVEEMIISKYPKYLRSQVYMAMLPILGTYGTNIRFDFLNGQERSLSFMTAVVARSAGGKGFAADLFNKLTKRLQQQDNIERKKANDYLEALKKTADKDKKPDDPHPRVRLFSDDITTSLILDYLDNLKGKHGLQFTEEIATLTKSKRTIYGNNDDLYRKAFENGIGGKESKSMLTRNIRIPIFLNTLFCGTSSAMHKFYNDPEGGLNNRIIFAYIPNMRVKGFPHYGKFTSEEQQMVDEMLDRLSRAGTDGNKTEFKWLDKNVMSLRNKWDKEDEENPDDVWYDLGKRSLEVAYRVGVLEWFVRDCPDDEKSIREINKLVRWMAESMRQNVYIFSGEDYENIAQENKSIERKARSRMSKNKKLFSLLPESFTSHDLIALRIKNGSSADVRMILSRWMADGMIRSTSKGHYHKVEPIVA